MFSVRSAGHTLGGIFSDLQMQRQIPRAKGLDDREEPTQQISVMDPVWLFSSTENQFSVFERREQPQT